MEEGQIVSTGDTERKGQILRRSDLFAQLDEPAMADVLAKSALVHVPRRKLLPTEPKPGLFVLGAGRVRVLRTGPDDREITLDYHGPGEVVGESALSESDRTPAVILARENVEAVRVPASLARQLLRREPRFAARLCEIMAERRRAAEHRLVALLTRSVESRVAEFVLDAARRYGVPDPRGSLIGIKFTHQEIASYVGSTRETVTLVLGELRRQKLLVIDHRRLVVTNPEGLSARI